MATTTTATTMITERLGGLAAVLALAGCASSAGPFAAWIDDDRSIAGVSEPWTAPAARARAAGGVEIPAGAGPEDYVRLALARNPSIKAAQQAVRRLADRIPQATSLDDPTLMVAPVGEMAETAAGEVGLMTGVSQKVPFPGKLETRGRIAAQDVAEAVQELQRARLEVAADTRRAWWGFYFATQAIDVTRRSRDLLGQLRDVAEARYRAGTATQQDVLRASVEMSNLDNDLVGLRQRRVTARAMLNRLIDRPVSSPLPAPAARTLDEIALELDTLLEQARHSHPTVRAARERIEASRQRLELARLDRWPDLTVSFSYNLVDGEGLSPVANGDDQWWVGLGINLPIWSERLDAAEHEAIRGILEGINALDDARNRIAFRVQDALARVESEQQQSILFRDVIIPQARQTVDASLSGYRAGRLQFLTVVDNWRKLLDFELMYHRNLAQLEQDFAELQEAVGRDLARRGPVRDAPPASREDGSEVMP